MKITETTLDELNLIIANIELEIDEEDVAYLPESLDYNSPDVLLMIKESETGVDSTHNNAVKKILEKNKTSQAGQIKKIVESRDPRNQASDLAIPERLIQLRKRLDTFIPKLSYAEEAAKLSDDASLKIYSQLTKLTELKTNAEWIDTVKSLSVDDLKKIINDAWEYASAKYDAKEIDGSVFNSLRFSSSHLLSAFKKALTEVEEFTKTKEQPSFSR